MSAATLDHHDRLLVRDGERRALSRAERQPVCGQFAPAVLASSLDRLDPRGPRNAEQGSGEGGSGFHHVRFSTMSSRLFDLSGRVAVVAGGTSGIGRALAVGLAEAGADVVASGRRADLIDDVAGEIETLGRRTIRVPADVTDR